MGQLVQLVCLNQVLTVLYVSDSPLSVSNISQMAMFYLNLPVLMIFP